MHHHIIFTVIIIGAVVLFLWHIFADKLPTGIMDAIKSVVSTVTDPIREKIDDSGLFKKTHVRKLVSPDDDNDKTDDIIKKYYPDYKRQDRR